MDFDHSKLVGKMREKNVSQKKMAQALGCTEASVWNKIHNRSEFTDKEIHLAMMLLDLNGEDPTPYFFTPYIAISQSSKVRRAVS